MRETLARSSVIADVAFSEPWLALLPVLLSSASEARYGLLHSFRVGLPSGDALEFLDRR